VRVSFVLPPRHPVLAMRGAATSGGVVVSPVLVLVVVVGAEVLVAVLELDSGAPMDVSRRAEPETAAADRHEGQGDGQTVLEGESRSTHG
jgi:hypothetical protein